MVNMFFPIFISLTSIVKFEEPKIEKSEWDRLNNELKQKLAPINHHICKSKNPEDIITLGDQANIIIRDFLIENPELFENTETTKRSKYKKHTLKSLEEAIKLKRI